MTPPMRRAPSTITCVDCGGTAHLIAEPTEDEELAPGAALPYRCSDCMERFDLVWEEEDLD